MGRYALFAGDDYYPAGGWNDFRRACDTLEAAYPADGESFDWWHIIDLVTGEQVGGS